MRGPVALFNLAFVGGDIVPPHAGAHERDVLACELPLDHLRVAAEK